MPGPAIDVGDGASIAATTGSGPAVLLEAGIAGPSLSWAHVQPRVAAFARVCAGRLRGARLERARSPVADARAHRPPISTRCSRKRVCSRRTPSSATRSGASSSARLPRVPGSNGRPCPHRSARGERVETAVTAPGTLPPEAFACRIRGVHGPAWCRARLPVGADRRRTAWSGHTDQGAWACPRRPSFAISWTRCGKLPPDVHPLVQEHWGQPKASRHGGALSRPAGSGGIRGQPVRAAGVPLARGLERPAAGGPNRRASRARAPVCSAAGTSGRGNRALRSSSTSLTSWLDAIREVVDRTRQTVRPTRRTGGPPPYRAACSQVIVPLDVMVGCAWVPSLPICIEIFSVQSYRARPGCRPCRRRPPVMRVVAVMLDRAFPGGPVERVGLVHQLAGSP